MKEISMMDKVLKLIDIRSKFDAISVENTIKQTIMEKNNNRLKSDAVDTKYLTGSILVKNNIVCDDPSFIA